MFEMLEDESSEWPLPLSLMVRFFIAVAVSIALGFIPALAFPRVCDNSGIFQAFYPCTMAIALPLGFIVGKVLQDRVDTLLWIAGTLWLLIGIVDGAAAAKAIRLPELLDKISTR